MRQAETLVHDAELRQTIIDNAKQYINTSYNEKVEFQGYNSVVKHMCRVTATNSKEDPTASEDSAWERKTRVRFAIGGKKNQNKLSVDKQEAGAEDTATDTKPDSQDKETPETADEAGDGEVQSEINGEQNQITEEKASLEEGKSPFQSASSEGVTFNATTSDPEETNPEASQEFPESVHATDKQLGPGENNADVMVEKPSVKLCVVTDTAPPRSPRSPRVVAIKTDAAAAAANKRSTPSPPGPTSSKDSPTAAASKGAATAGKNGQKPRPVSASNGAKKTATGTSKKTPLSVSASADKAAPKPPPTGNRSATRTYSDSGALAKPRAGDVGTRRSLNVKK